MVDTFCLDVRIESGLDGVTGKDDKEDVGNCECNYKDAHAPENGMKPSVREDSAIEEQNRDFGQGQRSDVEDDTGTDSLGIVSLACAV